MMARFGLGTLSLVLLATNCLHAQSQPNDPGLSYLARMQQSAQGDNRAANPEKMYEDIEIFRRILDRKLHAYYPMTTAMVLGGGMMGLQGGGALGMQGGMGGLGGLQGGGMSVAISPTLEGVYLEGQGILYTATLGSVQPRGKAETTPPVAVDEWESIRRQIRREKDEPAKTEPSKPLELSEVLLKLLAEHGRHFSQLKENESLILILTVREDGPAERAKRLTKKSDPTPLARQAQEQEMVGDLHLKQWQFDVAINSYRKALELNSGGSAKQEAALRRKIAQCYLAQEQYEKAKAELDAAVALLKKGKDDKEKSTASVALPEKITISVPKRLLDFAATNKLSFEEFRNKATVRKLTFGELRRGER